MYLKLTVKQKKFSDEYIIRRRIRAAFLLGKRYRNIQNYISEDLVNECFQVIKSLDATAVQKNAAKTILVLKFGAQTTNNSIESFAIVTDRSDALVTRWRKKIKERDKVCQLCGSASRLAAHHISHWADDPINRINPENGILLCSECHSLMHPELAKGLFGVKK